ncbi:hypothetical protein CLOM_g19136 [Closterium sp. NIES-68]|nr:hypothetical protein CLOM_g19136 [Closterium sp. NIES-68]GJP65593.1 hypothetical protein CLOP_g22466 [Closterium sp. NIES-67]
MMTMSNSSLLSCQHDLALGSRRTFLASRKLGLSALGHGSSARLHPAPAINTLHTLGNNSTQPGSSFADTLTRTATGFNLNACAQFLGRRAPVGLGHAPSAAARAGSSGSGGWVRPSRAESRVVAAGGLLQPTGGSNEDDHQGTSGGNSPRASGGKARTGAASAAITGSNDAKGRSQRSQQSPPRRTPSVAASASGAAEGERSADRAASGVKKSSKGRAGLVRETAEEGRAEERRDEGRDEHAAGRRGEHAAAEMEAGADSNNLGRPLLPQGRGTKEQRGGWRKVVGGGAPRTSLAWRGVLPHVLASSIIAFLFGYHMSVVNGPLESMAVELLFADSAIAKASVVSIFLLGAFLGCSASSTVADSAGRKKGFQICSMPILLGSILCAMASSLSLVVTGRFLLGFGLGMAIPIMALYIPEISPAQQRGTFGAIPQVFTCTGILTALLAAALLPASSWRLCFWIAAVPAVVFCMACEFLVESPRWLAQHGKWAEAAATVSQLLGEAKVQATMDDLHHSFGAHSKGHGGWEGAAKGERKEGRGELGGVYEVVGGGENGKGVVVVGKGEEEAAVVKGMVGEKVTWGSLFSKRHVRVVTIGATLFALQQLSGINAIFFFSSHLFKSAGIQSGAMASVAMGTLNLVASLVCSALIDRVGRKALITGSFVGMGLCMAVQAAVQAVPWMAPMAPLVTLAATLVYVACFTMGAGPVPGLMLPEMLPNHIRAKGMAFAMCVHWVFNFMVGFSFLPLMVRFGPVTLFSFFACICFAGALFTSTSLVETAGRSLEEIEEQLLPPA